ncbi:MAG: MFS transporter [Arenicellales bacterium]|nr:MFS transporter [Arenicellales bacterium]
MWTNPKVWSLAVAETVAWAGIFYLFPAMLVRWENHFGWSRVDLVVGFTAALVVSASTAVFAGRLIDRGHGRVLMTTSAVAGALLVGLLPLIEALWQFYLIWLLVGVTMSGCLYEPCFAFLTRIFYPDAKRPIIMVTLVAGFAGTLCFPLSHYVADAVSWQASTWLFSLLVLVIAAPLFWYGASFDLGVTDSEDARVKTPFSAIITPLLKNPVFWCLAIAFWAFSLNHSMIISHILPLLESRGVSPTHAVIAASTIGVAQVLGRLVLIPVEQRVSMLVICMCAFMGLSVASVNLAWAGTGVLILILFVICQGGSVGISSIAKPTVTADLLGQANFGAISAVVSMAYVLGFASGPTLSGYIWSIAGYSGVLKATFSLGLIGLSCLVAAGRLTRS